MRIRSSGSGFGNFGGGESRSDSFRQKHRLGQKVKGKLIKHVSDEMAWVSIGGDNLLAQLQSKHPEGTQLTFIVKQLVPNIILKEVFELNSVSANTIGMASAFDTSRILFENKFKTVQDSLSSANPIARLSHFLELLAKDTSLHTAFKDATDCARTISTQLQANNTGRILYQPWLVPESRRQATFVRSFSSHENNPLIETIIEFEHTSWGMVRAEFLYKKTKAGYKLKLQHLKHGKALLKYLNTRQYSELTAETECLGIAKLPQSAHGGILTELVFRTN